MIIHGPRAIRENRTITIPDDLMRQVGLDLGDQVYLAQHDEVAEAIVIWPIEVVTRWIDQGRSLGSENSPTSETSTPDET